MKKDKYMYPAVFNYDDDGISVSFPDLPGCFSCADTDEEAMYMAKDAMGLHLYGLEDDSDEIPDPTPLNKVPLDINQRAVLVEVYMPLIRPAIENLSVKKTLTIPQWLNKLAEENKVNFSQVLQSALKEYLGLDN
ncbi:MAG: type II toxin-antitoxin system HicB family antitoxin [Tissierellaceae bacterium]|nr:type II toxin-antitoxin system HicB family antitoxin [Tissierellaceae bacterium]